MPHISPGEKPFETNRGHSKFKLSPFWDDTLFWNFCPIPEEEREWMAGINFPSSHSTWCPSKRAEDVAGRTNLAGCSALLRLKLFEAEGDEAQLYGSRAFDAI
ncbi:hypothetical protein KY289_037402 [Solanum tuberosum]|nr:hypothetical protein KY289_037402 [Solanum tuberosum]